MKSDSGIICPSIDVFNEDGTMSEKAGMFIGVDRFKAKELAEIELHKSGNLVKVENYNNKIGRSERTDAVIEPRLSVQWFLKMKELSKPALDAVLDGDDSPASCEIQKPLPSLDGKCA